jgi:alpha-amylase
MSVGMPLTCKRILNGEVAMNLRRLVTLCLTCVLLAACKSAPTTPAPTVMAEPTPTTVPPTPTTSPDESPAWLQDAILYEIVPRSFYDSNGDGIGDLPGITSKLDYIQALGANTLWLTPVFSATDSLGLNVTDYATIAPGLGTKEDLTNLIREAHNRKMRVVMDLPMAYTSSESVYFKDAYKKPTSPYSDWYQWTNTAHTAYKSYGNVRTLPLLDHKSASVQSYFTQLAQTWLNAGVDGFRVSDADNVPHEFLKLYRQAFKQTNPNAVLLGEIWNSDPKKLAPFFQDEFDALFDVPLFYALAANPDRNGGGMLNGRGSSTDLDAALNVTTLYTSTAGLVRFTGNYDTNRTASLVNQNVERARMAALLVLTLPGTPLIYYGDEIGMPGSLGTGALAEEYRRAPMDWTQSGKGAGVVTWFKNATPVNKPNDNISVEEEQNVKGSLWSFYKMLIAQRKEHAALRSDNFQTVASACRTCYAFLRWDANDFYLMAINFSDQTQSLTLDLAKTPRNVSGAGEDLIREGTMSMPSNGRLTLTMEAREVRIVHWGK